LKTSFKYLLKKQNPLSGIRLLIDRGAAGMGYSSYPKARMNDPFVPVLQIENKYLASQELFVFLNCCKNLFSTDFS